MKEDQMNPICKECGAPLCVHKDDDDALQCFECGREIFFKKKAKVKDELGI